MKKPSKDKHVRRQLYEIAEEIRKDWRKQPGGIHFSAKPYLEAMLTLNDMKDIYVLESASEIVARFLCNAAQWRGETARRVKKELNYMLKHPGE